MIIILHLLLPPDKFLTINTVMIKAYTNLEIEQLDSVTLVLEFYKRNLIENLLLYYILYILIYVVCALQYIIYYKVYITTISLLLELKIVDSIYFHFFLIFYFYFIFIFLF